MQGGGPESEYSRESLLPQVAHLRPPSLLVECARLASKKRRAPVQGRLNGVTARRSRGSYQLPSVATSFK
jgi:hypothetical protein